MNDCLLTRREFGKLTAGIVISFALFSHPSLAAEARLPGDLEKEPMLDAWVGIGPDGKVTICTGKVELGQGILTALAQIAAEELDLPFSAISMLSGDTERTPDEDYTVGSHSIENGGMALRYACAEVRALLVGKASKRLGFPPRRLKVVNGTIKAPSGVTVSYAELAKDGLLRRQATGRAQPKSPKSYAIVGKPVPRLDIPAKATGEAVYVQDLRLPDMVFGRVVRSPGPHDQLLDVDLPRVRLMPGVLSVVWDGDFLGVVALREEQAIQARDKLRESARWRSQGELPEPDRIHLWLQEHADDNTVIEQRRSRKPATIVKKAAATYTKSYGAHASIGPSCAVAELKDGRLRVWSHTQGVYPLRRDLAAAMLMDPKLVAVKHLQGAGCYGHNGADDVALDAALLARAVPGRPVKVQWMRDDEFGWEPLGSAMMMKLSAGLSADGSIARWQHEVWSNTHNSRPGMPGGVNLLAAWQLAKPEKPAPVRPVPQPAGGLDRNEVPLYQFPNRTIIRHLVKEMPLRTSALRSLGAYGNVFAIECFMDELAAASGADPVKFRLRHLKDPRARAVIELAAEKASREPAPGKGDMHGRGFGFARYKNMAAYVACVAEVVVNRETGEVVISRIVAAADAGQIINPIGVEMQIEGGIIQSASWTLKESVKYDRTKVISRDWIDYPIMRFPEVPKVEVHLINRPEEKAVGAGEAAMGPTVAAITNAVSNALGRRVRHLPLIPERILLALSEDAEPEEPETAPVPGGQA
jgi:nicotinate dehydrogenase subunit B